MTGSKESVIGFGKEDFLGLFLGEKRPRIGVAKGPAVLNAVVVDVDAESRRARSIERVYREHA